MTIILQSKKFVNSRLLNLVPIHDFSFLNELETSSKTETLLKDLSTDNLEKLIRIREQSLTNSSLKRVNEISFRILRETFSFDRLEVKEISWDSATAQVVQFIGENDRVRPVDNWKDLKRRLEGDFKCFGVFHNQYPFPVSFVYIRLYRGLAGNLNSLLNDVIPEDSLNSCVFYSISSPFKGLNGIEFGGRLIKSVLKKVKEQNPQIKTFATFSPIPNFVSWLHKNHSHLSNLTDNSQILQNEADLMEICAKYLEKNSTTDPVAKFHYRNGAELGPIRFAADSSTNSLKQSYGIQVNYIYSQ